MANKEATALVKELEAINEYVVLAPEHKYGQSTLLYFSLDEALTDARYYRERLTQILATQNPDNELIQWLIESGEHLTDTPHTPQEYIDTARSLNI